MANQETAYGLRPIGMVGSGANSTGITEYELANNDTNVIFNGEIVVPLATGFIGQAGATNGGTTQALGVLTGVMYHDATQKKPVWLNYWPGSGGVSVDTNHPVRAYVADNPNQLFQIASDASTTDRATAQGLVFANTDLGTSARTGSTDTGSSTSQMSVANAAATATLPLRIVGLVDDVANSDYTVAGIPFVVRLNAHFNAGTRSFDSQTTADSTGLN